MAFETPVPKLQCRQLDVLCVISLKIRNKL